MDMRAPRAMETRHELLDNTLILWTSVVTPVTMDLNASQAFHTLSYTFAELDVQWQK